MLPPPARMPSGRPVKGQWDVDPPKFNTGDSVVLGNGDHGVVKERVERAGFSGFRVEVMDSEDPDRIGIVVGASPSAMRRGGSAAFSPGDLVAWSSRAGFRGYGCVCVADLFNLPSSAIPVFIDGVDSVGGFSQVALRKIRSGVDFYAPDFEGAAMLAVTPAEHSRGLQGFTKMPPGVDVLLFAFPETRRASFHMGSVSFPIDIFFFSEDARVVKAAFDCRPGSLQTWAADAAFVAEAPAGLLGLEEGDSVEVQSRDPEKASAKTYDLLRTITDASA